MIISIKGIKNKINEWKPAEQYYFSQQELESIINEEGLLNDMNCVKGVGFDTAKQTFINVVIDCNNYKGEYIYLVKSNEILKDKEYFWAYVTSKSWNTSQKIILELTIDTISSSLDLFNQNKFKGQVYTERTNNYERSINDYHSDACSSIENKQTNIINTTTKVNKKIDVFIDRNLFTFSKRMKVEGISEFEVKFEKKGTVFTQLKGEGDILGQQALQNISEPTLFKYESLPTTFKEVLEYNTPNSFDDEVWYVDNEQLEKMKNIFGKYPINADNNLSKMDKIITDVNNRKWVTLPKIFEVGDGILETFEFDIPKEVKEIDLKNHKTLHNEYFLVFNNLFNIPLDFFKLKDKIYGKRIVKNDGINYTLYYEKERLNEFYTLDLPLQNSLSDITYKEYQRDLELAYANGQKGFSAMLPDLAQNLVQGGLGLAAGGLFSKLAAVKGGGAAGFSNLLGGFGLFNAVSIPFKLWKEQKQEKYEAQKILSKPKVARALMVFEAFEKVLFGNTAESEWAYFSWTDQSGANRFDGYTILRTGNFNIGKKDYFNLVYSTPIKDDIDKINLDQELYGNIVNQTFINLDNPLKFNELTENHLYFQGRILPDINPVDNFMLDNINEQLIKGIYINKTRKS